MSETTSYQPLAARLRPRSLNDFVGQPHILAPGKPLYEAITHGHLHSMILWGPPGTGKTTLAKLMTQHADAHMITLSAVMSGVKDIRAAVEVAQDIRASQHKPTVLFIDEVHRFNKSQQDAFLPYVEDGTLILIGATTENPSFELNSALLSRARVYVLKMLTQESLLQIIEQALTSSQGLTLQRINFPEPLRQQLAMSADGDARRLLNLLEIIVDLAPEQNGEKIISEAVLKEALAESWRRFDKYGENFYDQISALHKSMRGSDPDAALYWLSRMLDGGCDPLYIARRVVRFASEDVGNADPRGLTLALEAWDVQERLGSPEGELAIAQAVVYLACAAKSNAVYTAFQAAMRDAKQFGSLEVPLQLRNAPTKLMRELDYGKNYRYAHNEENAFAAGENYFPADMPKRRYYEPVARGLEIQIAEKLANLRKLNEKKQ